MERIVRIVILLAVVVCTSCRKLHDSPYVEMGMSAPAVATDTFASSLEREAMAEWRFGNRITTLVNGKDYFPEMLDAVKSAQRTITFETFVAVDGYVTYDLVMAMCERAKAGVQIHVIIDGVGSRKLGDSYLIALENAGVEVEMYRPYRGLNYLRPFYSNNRDHRKIMVVDGKVGFTGGAGYADCWKGDAKGKWEWRDTMYKVEGPLVADLQKAFMNNWVELGNTALSGESYFPKLSQRGGMKAQMTLGAPYEREDTLGASYLLAIDAAKQSILIEHAYFVPNKKLREALLRARSRGVEIDVIVPNEHIDTAIVRQVSKSHWPELLDSGIRIYEFQPSMMHGKLIVVDDTLSIIGSGNFDDRTFFINDEINVHVVSEGFAKEQRAMFEHDLKASIRMGDEDAKAEVLELPLRWIGKLIEPQL